MEEDFPRGGVEKVARQPVREDNLAVSLFKDKNIKSPKKARKGELARKFEKEKKSEKGKKFGKKYEVSDKASGQAGSELAETLSVRNLYPGMLVLGCVKQARDYSLQIDLPNGLSGTVAITSVSQAYTDRLQKFADQNPDDETQSIHSLPALFKVGTVLPVKVLSNRPEIKLTINPQDVNSGMSAKNLHDGLMLYGSVASEEDHGYVMDVGLKEVQAFLPKANAEKYIKQCNEGSPLKVGQCMLCCVNMPGTALDSPAGHARVIRLTVEPSKLKEAQLTDSQKVAFSALVPGMKVQAKVQKVLGDGLLVVFGSHKASVHRNSVTKSLTAYQTSQQLDARILYIHPLSKDIMLTLQPHIVKFKGAPLPLHEDVRCGEVIEDAVVKRVEKNKGVYFTVKGDNKGQAFSDMRHLSDKKIDDVFNDFPKGSSHRCRVIRYYALERLSIVTLRESEINEKLVRVDDVTPGEKLECTVKQLQKKGAVVQLSKKITGFIPNVHLADVTLKHPEKKFSPGDKLKCRVLFVNPSKSNITLTNKRSLVKSKLPIITDLSQCEPGQELEGFISSIKDFGVHIRFYNEVQGFVSKSHLSLTPIDYPEKIFYKGQVVRCRVLNVNPAENKLKLTLVLDNKVPFGQKKASLPADFKIGKIVSCTVLNKTELGLDVRLGPSGTKGFLPKMHLSDSVVMCERLMDVYKEGDVINEVMYYKQIGVLVTKKDCLLTASKDGRLVTTFDQVQLGMMIPGVVEKHMDYGMFVEFPGGMFGLVPNRYAADQRVQNLDQLYRQGQSVVAKVVEIKEDKKRFLASLRMLDCYHGDTSIGLEMAKNYLKERKAVFDFYRQCKDKGDRAAVRRKLVKFQVGQVYQTTVTSVNESGVLCKMESGLKALATADHIKDVELEEGSIKTCVVLHIDIAAECLEVSFLPKLVQKVHNFIKRGQKASKAHEGQVLKGQVLHVTEDVVLVALKSHAAGQLAYLPGRRHLNDVLEHHQYGIDQVNKVTIKSTDEGIVLASLKVHEDKSEQPVEEGVVPHVARHSLQVGDVRKAKVRKILNDGLSVILDDVTGRIHVTEIYDTITNGCKPLNGFSTNQTFMVKVVGFRETRFWSYLPISHPNRTRAMPECSMRPSIVSPEKLPDKYLYGTNYLAVGDKVVAYVTRYSGHCLWMKLTPTVMGRAYILDLPDHLSQDPENEFESGAGYNATVVGLVNETLVEISLTGRKADSEVGGVTRGQISLVKADTGVVLTLAGKVRGMADLTDLSDQYVNSPTTAYRVGQVVSCYVVSKEKDGKRCVCSLRQSRLEGTKAPAKTPDVQTVSDLSRGQVIKGFIVKHLASSVLIRLGHGVTGRADFHNITTQSISEVEKALPVGTVVTAKILRIMGTSSIDLSLLEKDTGVSPNIPKCFLKLENSDKSNRKRKGSESEVKGDDAGKKRKDSVEQSSATVTDPDSDVCSGDRKKVKQKKKSQTRDSLDKSTVSAIEKTGISTPSQKVKAEDTDSLKREKRKSVTSDGSTSKKQKVTQKLAKVPPGSSDTDSGVEVNAPAEPESGLERLAVTDAFSWDSEFKMPSLSFSQGEISSDDSDDLEDEKPVRKTKEEKRKEKQEEEKRLFEIERQRLEGENLPETIDDFDRLALQSPNSSLVWLRYMAYLLETTQIDKARAVAERALKTISFREEQEKLNVWFAYLSLENMYGTPETVQKLLARAIQQADAVQIYQQLVNIYLQSGKVAEAEQIHNTLAKRHGQLLDVWVKFGQFYFQNDRHDSARRLLQRSLKSLDKTQHVPVIAKFAQMEFKYGDPERGKTMFENILSNYPKRTDLWSVYIDMVTKQKEFDNARQLYERVTGLKVSAKKMKFFFKKYLEFEQQHGTETHVAAVKQKALKYVESRGYVDE